MVPPAPYSPPDDGGLFLRELALRAVAEPYYNMMIVSFVASLSFGFMMAAAVAGRGGNWILTLTGLGSTFKENMSEVYAWARVPLRDAAALFTGLGFLGTVYGISVAIDGLRGVISGGDPEGLIIGLRTAFDTTFIGLIASLVLAIFLMLLDQFADTTQRPRE
mmetsp:Transcript_22853/g.38178  ORF Transcript_22853/g.38178 Transcript_22853/m.38178 type:complete len:163 (-) Transcript_22853:3055-3543(-)